MGFPARPHLNQVIRHFGVVDSPSAAILEGTPLALTSGEVDVADSTAIVGFAAAAADPADAFGSDTFVVDVTPGRVEVFVAMNDATFLMAYYANAGTDDAPTDPAESLIGTTLDLTALADGTWVTDGATGDIANAVECVGIVESPENGPIVGMVEVRVVAPQTLS